MADKDTINRLIEKWENIFNAEVIDDSEDILDKAMNDIPVFIEALKQDRADFVTKQFFVEQIESLKEILNGIKIATLPDIEGMEKDEYGYY